MLRPRSPQRAPMRPHSSRRGAAFSCGEPGLPGTRAGREHLHRARRLPIPGPSARARQLLPLLPSQPRPPSGREQSPATARSRSTMAVWSPSGAGFGSNYPTSEHRRDWKQSGSRRQGVRPRRLLVASSYWIPEFGSFCFSLLHIRYSSPKSLPSKTGHQGQTSFLLYFPGVCL